ncbi:MAG: ATP-binding protein [Alphaproteobacteria bacterium]|nr:ATP-binding protein [Alphaproteobacteria bacterium]
MPRRPPFRRILGATLALGLPGLAGLALVLWLGPDPRAIVLAVAIVLLGAALLAYRRLRDLHTIQHHAERLAAGERPERPQLLDAADSRPLVRDLEILQERFAEAQAALESEVQAREAVIDGLPDPLLIVDERRQVVEANAAAAELLGPVSPGTELSLLLRNPLLLEAVDQVLVSETDMVEEVVSFTIVSPVEREIEARVGRISVLNASPANPAPGRAVIVLHDLTALMRAEQMRVDFVANASHELRTPIATLGGFIETLRGPARDDPEARSRFLGIMSEQAERMARLVDDLLSLSRIEQEEHRKPSSPVNLEEILTRVCESLQLHARARDMEVEIVSAPLTVVGEEDQLIQLFQNLIDNSIKYARAGTVVRVTATPVSAADSRLPDDQAGVRIEVKDEGPGIPKRHLPRLTERFYRVDTARSRRMGGTGLGLAIVKHIVSRHRGRLHIQSTEGIGTKVTVTLPSGRMQALAAD